MKQLKTSWILVGTFVAGILGGGLVVSLSLEQRLEAFRQKLSREQVRYTPARSISPTQTPTSEFEDAAARAVPSVVYIAARSRGGQSYFGLEEFFAPPTRASGSGVIIREDGFIVTNHHVVEGATELTVTLHDNAEYAAELVAVDPNTDIAVIRIADADPAETFPALTFANSDDVPIGAWVLAIGNPFNLTSTVTAGIVSARARSIGILHGRRTTSGNDYAIESFLQTDAAVNPGNSGGALINLKGHLVGINTAIATEGESFQGYSFAIPANLVRKVSSDLIRYGVVQRGFIGVSIRDVNAVAVAQFHLTTRRGAVVYSLTEGGAAATSGLRVGDVITQVGTHPVHSASALQEQVANHSPGEAITVTYLRGAEKRIARVVLRNAQGTTALLTEAPPKAPISEAPPHRDLSQALREALGASFAAPSAARLEQIERTHGVLVVQVVPGMPVAYAGITEGTILTHLEGEPLFSANQFFHAVLNARGPLKLQGITPEGAEQHYTLSVE